MAQSNTNLNQPNVGVVYVGRTEGELITVLGKVGMVSGADFLERRVKDYRVADRIFHFVMEAAFVVKLPERVTILDVETRVHSALKVRGLEWIGENFRAPEGSMTFLARMVEEALHGLGYEFAPLDVTNIQQIARNKNSDVWGRLRKSKKGKKGQAPDPNDAWLNKHCQAPMDLVSMARPRDYVRNVLALGYLIKDLAAGSGIESLEVSLDRGGCLKIFPSNLESALFEHRAEVDLNLASTTSFASCPTSLGQLPVTPHAMTLLLGQNMESIEITNSFLPPTKDRPEEVRISPDLLAALGRLGGSYNEYCLFEGLGVKAEMPLELNCYIKAYPDLLPGLRFWVGVLHCRRMGFRFQDFDLPMVVGRLWDMVSNAAQVMEVAGMPVPESVQAWVAHAWLPAVA